MSSDFRNPSDIANRNLMNRFDAIESSAAGFHDPPIPTVALNIANDSVETSETENGISQRIETADGPIWIEGSTLLCACPDCQAPISIRLWLMLADCWRCQTSVELTAEQQQAVERLAQQLEQNTVSTTPLPVESASEAAVQPASPSLPTPQPRPRPTPKESFSIGPSRTIRAIRDTFNSLPAWLISFFLHLILLLILALIVWPSGFGRESITLSTFVGPNDIEGGDPRIEMPEDRIADDLLPANDLDIGEEELRKVAIGADQDARELQVDPDPVAPLADLDSVKESITTRPGNLQSLAARDPRVRAEIVKKEGGTTLTEAAVSRGLRWLASVQNQDGSWSLEDYHRHDNSRNRGDAAGTSLALLPFLGAGQTHEFGKYKTTVAKGLKWLLEHQERDGSIRYRTTNNQGMYAHGQATIVLVEAFAMTGDQTFREPAQKALDYIQRSQHRRGGWRYSPRSPGDTSVFGWQLMALQCAQTSNSGLKVDTSTLKLANYFLDSVSQSSDGDDGVLYRYMKGRKATPAMTAEAILCRMYLGWRKDDPRLIQAIDWMTRKYPPNSQSGHGQYSLYYWYYCTQVLHHFGGRRWEKWNNDLRDLLVVLQMRGGNNAGSWDPDNFAWGEEGGRIYVTSLAVCTLEVYYRHLPLFKQLDLD